MGLEELILENDIKVKPYFQRIISYFKLKSNLAILFIKVSPIKALIIAKGAILKYLKKIKKAYPYNLISIHFIPPNIIKVSIITTMRL